MAGQSLLQLYNSPPNGAVTVASDKGDSSIKEWKYQGPQELGVRRDGWLAFRLLQFAQNYLTSQEAGGTSCDAFAFPLSSWVRDATNRALTSARVGNEARNADIIPLVANYVREFIAAASHSELGDVQIDPFGDDDSGGPQPHRMIERNGANRVLML
jgi:hypothetical protein